LKLLRVIREPSQASGPQSEARNRLSTHQTRAD